ncbi:MAG TPA: DUF4232 domain-containing protein [Nocardioidaceae bacterium]|nr:DUF4232 domain-containing protein [Nocardioidaceae bacterium]
MKLSVRLVALVGAAALTVGLTVGSAASGKTTTSQSRLARACTGHQLKVRLGGLDAAAGSAYQTIRFTNTSGRRCVLKGFPHVSFRGKHGHRIGYPAARTGHPRRVALRPGWTAKASLQIPNWHNFPRRDCDAKGSPRLRVVPPGTHRKVGFHYPAKTCTTKKGRSYIRPVH